MNEFNIPLPEDKDILKIGIVTDPYKVKVFKKELDKRGYKYKYIPSSITSMFSIMLPNKQEKVDKLAQDIKEINTLATKRY